MKKLFRYHSGGLAESLDTTIEVKGLADLQEKIEAHWLGYVSNIRIQNRKLKDDRLPPEWNGISYYVIADYACGEVGCIGMSNFFEK